MRATTHRRAPKRKAPAASPKKRSQRPARDAILDTAEELFAERGLQAVSLREINLAAGFSIAALHYHFSTRDGVLRALLERSQPPIFEQRAAMLAELAQQKRPTVEGIVNALVRPMATPLLENTKQGTRTLRFLARLYFDRAPQMAKDPGESIKLFLPLLQRALPHLDEQTLLRRWLLAAELALHALGNMGTLQYDDAAPKSPTPEAIERYLSQLVQFICGGLSAR